MKLYHCLNCKKENLWTRQKSNKYCDNKCQQDFQFKQYIKDWKKGVECGRKGKLQTSRYIHRYILEKQDYKCDVCKISDYNGLPITLELDHINGDATNNTEKNLRCLCPNCHSQTPTYRSKNKGSGRKGRKI